MSAKKIAVLVGSLRKESFTRKIARELITLAPDALDCEMIEIGALPLYNQDLEENGATAPAAWTLFRQQVAACAGVLFLTPEYNRSVPAPLKNAVDVGSRPYAHSIWSGKPAAIVSVSPGALGGFGANHHLRQSMVFLDMPLMQQPEAYIGSAAGLLGADGRINNDATRQLLQKFMRAYASWAELHQPASA